MSDVEKLARAMCRRVTAPGYCDRCEGAAEHVLADPGPLLDALAETGVLDKCRRTMWDEAAGEPYVERRYVTEWRPTDARA